MRHDYLKYIPTPGEKHVGVAVIRTTFDDPQQSKIITAFKILPSEKGGYWVNGAALKTGVGPNGKDTYLDSFRHDSSYENDELRAFVLMHSEAEMNKSGASVFGTASPSAHQQQAPRPSPQTQQAQQPFQQSQQYARQPQYVQPEPEPEQNIWNTPMNSQQNPNDKVPF